MKGERTCHRAHWLGFGGPWTHPALIPASIDWERYDAFLASLPDPEEARAKKRAMAMTFYQAMDENDCSTTQYEP